MATNAIKYLSNVGRSVAYSTVDQVKQMNPAITSFSSTNAETMRSAYDAITHLKQHARKIKTNVLESDYGKAAIKAKENLFEDIRTGKFYNKERISKSEDAAADKLLNDDAFDFGFEFVDDSSSDDDEISTNDMLDLVAEKSSNAVSTAVARSAEYIVTANSEMNKSMYEQNKAIFSGIHADINVMNDNIGKLIEFASNPLQTHIQNSTTYYETSTKLDQERNQMLKEMLDLQREYYKPSKTSGSSKKATSVMDLIDSEGMLDLSAFGKHIKDRIKSKDGGTTDMIKMMFEMGGIDSIIASPLQVVTDAVAKKLIPSILKDSMKSFNESLSGLFTSAIAKLNASDSMNPIVNFLQDLIGLKPDVKKEIDTSKYNKGAIPFDGVTKKAIVEVIPTYLSKILSAVSGSRETRYNYETGKFIDVKDIKGYLDSIEKDASRNASYDIRSELDKYSSQIRFGSKEERNKFDQDLQAILDYSYKRGMLFNSKDHGKSAKSYGLKNGEASDVNLEIIRALFDKIPNSVKMGYATRMFQEKDNSSRRMQELEDSGVGIYTALFNESIKAIKEASEDAAAAPGRGGNILSGIYDEVVAIRELLSYGVKVGKRGRRPAPSKKVTPKTTKSSETYIDYKADKYALEYSGIKKDTAYDKVTQQIQLFEEDTAKENKKATLVDKVLQSRNVSDNFKVIFNNMNELVHKPANILGGLIKKADLALYNLIFGDEEKKNKREAAVMERGIGGYIIDQLKEQFGKFGDWVQKEVMFPIARFVDDMFSKKIIKKIGDFFGIDTENIGKGIRTKLFGERDKDGNYITSGLLGDQYRRFANEFKKAKKFTKESFSGVNDYFGFTKKYTDSGRAKKRANDQVFSFIQALNKSVDKQPGAKKNDGVGTVENAASGMKRVSKTGIIAASEGELIVPADLNPFNVEKNKRKEDKEKNRFIDTYDLDGFIKGYAEGGNVNFSDYIQNILNSGDESKIKTVTKALGRMKTQKNVESARAKLKNLFQGFSKEDYEEGRDKNLVEKSIDKLGEGIRNLADYIKGLTPDEKDEENDKKIMFSSATKEMKKYLPEMGAGAVMGAGVSLVTGLIGGPLVGAAVGSGISLVKNSKVVQEMLFGKEVVDEEGNKERQGGLLSKKLSNNLTKYVPAIGKGSIVGAITSILPFVPGGPVAGILLGGAAGFVSKNEEIREKLFGEDTKLGKMGATIKKALPNIGAGAIAGLIAGPFGLVPNLVVGSAIGFASSTDKFKRFMFGYDDENGVHHDGAVKTAIDTLFTPIKNFALETGKELKGWAEKYIMQPLKDASEPLKKQAELMFKGIADGVTGALNKLFEDKFGAPFDKFLKDRIFSPVASFVKNFAKGALAPIKGLVSLPFKAIGAVGDHYKKKQIQSGDATYTTAAERMAFRNKKGTGLFNRRFGSGEAGRFTSYDRAIMQLQEEGDTDRLQAVYDALNNVQDQDAAFADVLNPAYKEFDKNVRHNSKLSYKDTKKIGKELRKMVKGSKDPDDASAKINKYIAKLDLDPDDKQVIQESANKYIASFKQYSENAEDRAKVKNSIFEEISDLLGVNVAEQDAGKLAKLLKNELPSGEVEEEKAPVSEATVQDAHEETISHIINIEKYLEQIAGMGPLKDNKVDEYLDEYQKDFDKKNDKYTRRKENIESIKQSIKDAVELVKYVNGLYEDAMDEGNSGFFRKVFGNKTIDPNKADQYNADGSKKTTEARDKWNTFKKGIKPDGAGEVENAASGMRRVKRTGVVAVSEGEMIVPKSLNPYDIARNTVRENIAKDRFYNTYGIGGIKGYAEGGTVSEDDIDTDGITVDNLKSGIKNSKIGKKAKKAYYTFVNGKPLRFVKDIAGKLMMDTSDSETKKNYKDIQEDDEQKESFFSKFTSIPGAIGKKFKKIFGKGDEEEEEDDGENGNPIFKFLSKVIGGKSKAATVATVAGTAIGLPILVGFWNDTIWPVLQPIFEPLADNIKNAVDGLWDKAKAWFNGEGEPTKDGYSAGFPGLVERLIKYWSSGLEVIFTKVVPKFVEVFIKCLPSVLVGVGKGIVNGLGALVQDFLDLGKPSTDPDKYYKGFDFKPVNTTSILGSGQTNSLIDKNWYSSSWNSDLSSIDKMYSGVSLLGNSSDSTLTNAPYLLNNMTSTGSEFSTSGTTNTGATVYNTGSYQESSSPIGTAESVLTTVANNTQNNAVNPAASLDIQSIEYGFGIYEYDASQLRGVPTESGDIIPMTVDELLSYDGIIAQATDGNTTVNVTGTTLLDYPEIAAQFGFSYRRLTDSEREAKRKELGVNTKAGSATVGGSIAAFTGKSFLRGDNRVGKALLKVGDNKVLRKIPIVGKPLAYASKGVGKVASLAGNLGKNVLPTWMTGKAKKTAGDAATRVAEDMAETVSDDVFEQALKGTASVADDAAAKGYSSTASKAIASLAAPDGYIDDAVIDATGEFVEESSKATYKTASERIAFRKNKATGNAAKAVQKLDNEANEGIIKKIINKISSVLPDFIKSNKVVDGISSVLKGAGKFASKETAEQATKELSEKLTSRLTKWLGENLAKKSAGALSKAAAGFLSAGIVTAAFGVKAFVNGWNNVNDYIAVADDVKEPSLLMRLIGGLVAALNEVFCMGLIPIDIVVSIVLDVCQQIPTLKDITSGVIEDREESAELVAKASEDVGFELSGVTEFNELRRNADKNDSWWRNNAIYKGLAGTKDEITVDEDGNYVYTKGEKGAVQKAWSGIKKGAGTAWDKIKEVGSNAGSFIFGNKETGEKNVFGKGIDKVKEQITGIQNWFDESGLGNWFSNLGSSISDLGSYTGAVFKDLFQYAMNWDYKRTAKVEDDDPLKGIKNGIEVGAKVLTFLPVQVLRVAALLYKKVFKPIGEGVISIGSGIVGTAGNMISKAWNGDIVGAFTESNDNANSEVPLVNTLSSVANNIVKVPMAVPTLIASGIGFVARNFKGFVAGVKEVGSGIVGTAGNMISKAWGGDIVGAFTESSDNAESDNDLVNKISSVANNVIKVPMSVPTLIASALGFVVRTIQSFVLGVKEVGSGIAGTAGNMLSMAWEGDLSGAFTESNDNANSDNDLVNKISSVANNVIKVPMAVPTVVSFAVGKVVDGFKSLFATIKNAVTLSSSDEKKIEDAQSGDMSVFSSNYWSNSPTESGFVGILQNITTYFRKIANIPLALVGQIMEPLQNAKDFIFGNKETGEKNILAKAGTWLDENLLGGLFTGGGSGLKRFNARGSSMSVAETNIEKNNGTFISQLDSKYANKKFNISGDSRTQTLGDTGCGPASAAMVINSFRGAEGHKMNLTNAAKEAINYKTEDQGVTADYFGDTFRKHGLNTRYIMDSNPTTRANNIAASLYSDNKVVLMGQDVSNASKQNSPFGPNAHYVVATGISPDGKYIYINDPESDRANIAYPSASVLNATQMGIAANAASGSGLIPRHRKILRLYNGSGSAEIEKAVWNGLRSAGYNEIATAAAMGNIKHESGFDPSLVEKGSGVGYGLVQWSYGRRTAYEKYARSKGKPASDINTQIEYLLKELKANSGVWTTASSRYGYGSLKRSDWADGKNIDTATKAFMCCFERPSYSPSVNHIDRRLKSAREYYQKYTGTAITGSTSVSGSSESGNTINTILDTINVFDNLAKGYGLVSETSSSTTTDSSGTTSLTTGGSDKQNQLVNMMKSMQGKLRYSQQSRNPENGSADCSSLVQYVYKKVLGVDPGSWTGAQETDSDTYVVTRSFDESKMQPGDLILYNGHVEMYAGDGQMIGHGGPDKGPKLRKLSDQGRFRMLKRWVGFKNGSGSGLNDKYIDKPQLRDIKQINWIENNTKTLDNKDSVFWNNKYDDQAALFSAMGSTTNGYSAPGKTADIGEVNVTEVVGNIQSEPSADASIQALIAIIKLLYKVVGNTSELQNIVSILGEIVSIMNEESKLSTTQANKQQAQILQTRKENLLTTLRGSANGGSDADPALQQLVSNVERLARA